jgi:hypothetical protein
MAADADKQLGRSPDLELKFLNKGTGEKGKIGVGWVNTDGSISIVLNKKVVLTENPEEVLMLFPKKNKPPF